MNVYSMVEISGLKLKLLTDGRRAYVIAGDIGIHPTTLSLLASGKQDYTQDHLRKLTEYFQCGEDEILDWYVVE